MSVKHKDKIPSIHIYSGGTVKLMFLCLLKGKVWSSVQRAVNDFYAACYI